MGGLEVLEPERVAEHEVTGKRHRCRGEDRLQALAPNCPGLMMSTAPCTVLYAGHANFDRFGANKLLPYVWHEKWTTLLCQAAVLPFCDRLRDLAATKAGFPPVLLPEYQIMPPRPHRIEAT